MRKRLYIAIGLALIAIALFFVTYNPSRPEMSAFMTSPTGTALDYDNSCSEKTETPDPTVTPVTVSDSARTVVPTKQYNAADPEVIAQISIETDIKTRTFDVMADVEEETLKHNLGHLPTSAMPGQEGICVIMGHRDTQFSILKYCEAGNAIAMKSDDKVYVYTVYDIEIVENDGALHFDVVSGANLALVTCYPFRYTGHAPQKLIIHAILNQD